MTYVPEHRKRSICIATIVQLLVSETDSEQYDSGYRNSFDHKPLSPKVSKEDLKRSGSYPYRLRLTLPKKTSLKNTARRLWANVKV